MNRELKFRAWDSITKKWLFGYEYPNLGGFSMKGEVMLFGEYSRFFESIPIEDWDKIILMQYTGLKDKNGKEVYEGDVIRQSSDLCIIESCVGGFDCQMLVELKNGGTLRGSVYNFSFLSEKYCEIIGNIYENPELCNH